MKLFKNNKYTCMNVLHVKIIYVYVSLQAKTSFI